MSRVESSHFFKKRMLPSMECYDCYLLVQRCFPELLLLDRAGCARRPVVPVLALVQGGCQGL